MKTLIAHCGKQLHFCRKLFSVSPASFFPALTGRCRFSGVDFSGTLFINNDDDDDFAGIVFSYQSSSAFYVFTWKKKRQTYWKKTPFPAIAEPGLQLKVSI